MLKYQPKGALSPDLGSAMARLFRLIQDLDLMASLVISDGKHGEFHISLDPSWSCCKMNKLPRGDISVRVRSKREDYPSREAQKKHIEQTINGLSLMYTMLEGQRDNLQSVMEDLKRAVSFEHYGEEFKGHTAEPPDPDKVPATLEEAADLILATLDVDQLTWVKATPLHEAMGQLHHGFGMKLRNSWSLWEKDTPIHQDVQRRYKLFGHGDDMTALIFTTLWNKVRGIPEEIGEAFLKIETDGMKDHWRKQGINPETGEKGLIL